MAFLAMLFSSVSTILFPICKGSRTVEAEGKSMDTGRGVLYCAV